jgi:hypothetical protein
MELIKDNKEKHRTTYFCGDRYRKVWANTTPEWISNHVQLLQEHMPGYVLDYGTNWIEYSIIPGTPVNTIPHTDDFILRIHKFCLENIQQTKPYVHGDWVLSNMLIHNNVIRLCDWDNFGIYPDEEVKQKLHSDLLSAFGERYLKVIYDSASV